MASARLNNRGLTPPAATSTSDPHPFFTWSSPQASLSTRDKGQQTEPTTKTSRGSSLEFQDSPENQDLVLDFEFRLNNEPVAMQPADELLSDWNLVAPLQVNAQPPPSSSSLPPPPLEQAMSPEKTFRRIKEKNNNKNDPFMHSPKAPRCSSNWKEVLGLKKLCLKTDPQKTTLSSSNSKAKRMHMKHLLQYKSSKSSSLYQSLSLPLLKDSDSDPVSLFKSSSLLSSSSSFSSSSSSSTQDHEDHPARLSLESNKPTQTQNQNAPRIRMVKARPELGDKTTTASNAGAGRNPRRRERSVLSVRDPGNCSGRGVSVDSPRMSSSGKIVFHNSLHKSSSSFNNWNAGNFNRYKYVRCTERSYSASVRVTPVLNVPVSSLRGSSNTLGSVFGFFSSSTSHKREGRSKKKSDHNRMEMNFD